MTTSSTPDAFRRHAFIRLSPESWQQSIAESGDLASLKDWLAHDRPLIVRRPCLSPDRREVHAGLALPGKRRLSYRIPVALVVSVEPPPAWENCRAGIRDDVWDALAPLRETGITLRVFGSHAWQYLSGLAYVTEKSDIDLIAEIDSAQAWRRFCRSMLNFTLPSEPRVDLEIMFQGDASFSWREFVAPGCELLVKSNQRFWLEEKAKLEALLHD